MYTPDVLVLRTVIPIGGEAALIRAAQAGDRAAFGRLYERYARMVHGILLAHAAAADAEDLMQDVFVTALERLDSLRDPEAIGGWLASVARNAARDFHRRRRPEVDAGEIEIVERAPARPGLSVEALAALTEIRKLPEAYREPLILRLVEGMNGPEIATRTGLTPASVRVNLCRGMKMLRERLEAGHE